MDHSAEVSGDGYRPRSCLTTPRGDRSESSTYPGRDPRRTRRRPSPTRLLPSRDSWETSRGQVGRGQGVVGPAAPGRSLRGTPSPDPGTHVGASEGVQKRTSGSSAARGGGSVHAEGAGAEMDGGDHKE